LLTLEYKIKASINQYKAIEEAIRITQFVRNKSIRYWMDSPQDAKINRFSLNKYSTELRNKYQFVSDLNSMAVQSASERAWISIQRFYDNCKKSSKGKKGYPKFQKDNRSVEYKISGWKLHPSKRKITFTDKKGIGDLKLLGKWDIHLYPLKSIKRVRIVRRADLAKSISDVGWYLFRQWIEYFASKFGRIAIAVAPQYTSQKCSNCGRIVKKSLSTRTHVCVCGCELHRDTNAAINILNLAKQARAGQARSNATGDATSTLVAERLSQQVASMNVESPRL
jgi:transposase